MTIKKTHILLAAVVLALSACCNSGGVQKPMDSAQKDYISYVVAKRQYVEALEKILLTDDPRSSAYRLVAIIGPQWGIGDVVALSNPLDLLTAKCRAPASAAPVMDTKWSSMPEFSSGKEISLAAGLPESVLKILGKDNVLKANFQLNQDGKFALTDIASAIAPKDSFESGLSDDCRQFLTANGGMLIRGVVSAKEQFRSHRQLAAGAGIKLIAEDLLTGKYDSEGAFELEDKAVTPKMYLVTYYDAAARSSGPGGARAVTPQEIERIEIIRVKASMP